MISGTSTDVSRFAGHFEHVFETTTAGITIQAPQVSEMIIFMSLLNRFWPVLTNCTLLFIVTFPNKPLMVDSVPLTARY